MPEPLALPIRTERLVLRAHTPEDADALLSYYGDAETSRYLLTEPITAAGAAALARERAGHLDLRKAGDRLSLALEHEGRLVGDVMLLLQGAPGSKLEIGWVLHPDATGRGLAAEAARAVLDLAFGHFGAHRVAAELDARNGSSARLCERLGMTREGLLRQDYLSKGEWTDTLHYGVLREEWSRESAGRRRR